jgi:high-affinity iron transporter
MFLSNGLIGLREGLEACMVIAILVAFLNHHGRFREIRIIWFGIATAVLTATIAAGGLAITASSMSERGEELFAGFASIVAVVLITGMIFWMRHSIQEEKRELESQLERALRVGPVAVFAVAFLAILREGLEGAVFVLVLSRDPATGAAMPILGFLTGVGVAVSVVWLLYRGLLRVRLAKLLTVTGLALVVVAAGIVAHGVMDLQAGGVLPGADTTAFDIGAVLPQDSWYGGLLVGVLSISAKPTVLAAVAWAGYLVTMLTLLLRSLRRPVLLAAQPAVARVGGSR